MKKLFLPIIIFSGLIFGNVEGYQQITLAALKTVSDYERETLLWNCDRIAGQVAEYYAGRGALQSSAYPHAVKNEITNYLQSVGTLTAYKLLDELRANGFRGYIR